MQETSKSAARPGAVAPEPVSAGDPIADALDIELRRMSVHLGRLAGEIEAHHPGDALERASLLTEAVERVRRVLKDLQWLAALEASRPERELVDVGALVDDLLARQAARVRGVDALVVRETLPVVWAAPSDLRVVFEEVLDNALRYRREDPLVIRFSARREDAAWCIEVTDNGRGFDGHHTEGVFDPLFVLVGDGVSSGSGLGLTAVRMLTERNGGTVSANSHSGVGTTLHVRLPSARR